MGRAKLVDTDVFEDNIYVYISAIIVLGTIKLCASYYFVNPEYE